MLARFQGFDHQVGVRIMASQDGDSVDVGVIDDFILGGGGILEAELLA
jgi:hypothetical protein